MNPTPSPPLYSLLVLKHLLQGILRKFQPGATQAKQSNASEFRQENILLKV